MNEVYNLNKHKIGRDFRLNIYLDDIRARWIVMELCTPNIEFDFS